MVGATRYILLKSRGNKTEANKVFVLAFFTALAIGGIFLLAGLLYSKEISYLLGANEDTIFMCNLYLKTILCFAPAFVLNHLLMSFVRNDDDPGLSMRAMMVGSLTNIIFDYVFMYWIELGVFGTAFATGLANLATYGIVANLALMILAVMNGISLGIQPLISKMYGLGHGKITSTNGKSTGSKYLKTAYTHRYHRPIAKFYQKIFSLLHFHHVLFIHKHPP